MSNRSRKTMEHRDFCHLPPKPEHEKLPKPYSFGSFVGSVDKIDTRLRSSLSIKKQPATYHELPAAGLSFVDKIDTHYKYKRKDKKVDILIVPLTRQRNTIYCVFIDAISIYRV